MTDELTPSLAAKPASDTDLDKSNRLVAAAAAISDALAPLIDGKVVLAIDAMIIVQHPDGKVGGTSINIGRDELVKGWAARQALRHHQGALGPPDLSESRVMRGPTKH